MNTHRDRPVHQLEISHTPYPHPPLNFLVLNSHNRPGTVDLVWDNPSQLHQNAPFEIIGVNLYRSHDSEFGPYHRLNEFPIGTNFWRDQTHNTLALQEDVTDQFILTGHHTGTQPEGPRYVFRTRHQPIVRAGTQARPAGPFDVQVHIRDISSPNRPLEAARVLSVNGVTGEVEIDPGAWVDTLGQRYVDQPTPGPNRRVYCTYRYPDNLVKTDLTTRVFYRITTVAKMPTVPNWPTHLGLIETPLERSQHTNIFETEKMDWIWREGVKRNRFLLERSGETVKVFIRKTCGVRCSCFNPIYGQARADCRICHGTSWRGGFEGPYDILVAPDNGSRRITYGERGTTVEKTYQSWTGPAPLLAHRDFIVKLNGERYSIGGIETPTDKGIILQQQFDIGLIDEADPRYQVPIDGVPPESVLYEEPSRLGNFGTPYQTLPPGEAIRWDVHLSTMPSPNTPQDPMTNHPSIPEEREIKGRSQVHENILY